VVEHTGNTQLSIIDGLGDLSHASVVYSRDARYAFVFGRDGGLTKVDLLKNRVANRVIQAGNSIGGAVSQDGKLVAVSNYDPGGVRVFDSDTLDLLADIPAIAANGETSKVVGLVDAPSNRFVFSLYDAGEIWVADMAKPSQPEIERFSNVGRQPYDALLTPDGRYYVAGLFGENGLAMLDLWHLERGVTRILPDYGRGEEPLPVYKMPHLEGWAIAGDFAFVPAVGRHEVLVFDRSNWQEKARIEVHGQPIFVMAQPDGRKVWVNFAMPNNDTLQVIDTDSLRLVETLTPGPAVLHMEFTPRGEHVWVSVRDQDQVVVYDTDSYAKISALEVHKPSGIFFSARAHRIGL
jgi:protein NirF